MDSTASVESSEHIVPSTPTQISREATMSTWSSLVSYLVKIKELIVLTWVILNSWEPDQTSWWVKFIVDAKISGLKDAVKPGIGIFRRLFWLCAFGAAFGCALYYSIIGYIMYVKYPIVVTVLPNEVNIGNIPFPTVSMFSTSSMTETVLTNVKTDFDEFLGGSENSAGSKSPFNTYEAFGSLFFFLRHICFPKFSVSSMLRNRDYSRELLMAINPETALKDDLKNPFITNHLIPLIKKSNSDCSNLIPNRFWKSTSLPATGDDIVPVFSDNGAGCAFNKAPTEAYERYQTLQSLINKVDYSERSLKAWKSWNPDKHLFKTRIKGESPKSQIIPGKEKGFSFIMVSNDPALRCNQFDSTGFRVAILSPFDDINTNTPLIAIPPDTEVNIDLYPEIKITDPETRSVPKEFRGCAFDDEIKLNFYQKYTQNNCLRECFADRIRDLCKCSLLSTPNLPNDTLCDTKDFECVADTKSQQNEEDCQFCLPSCTQVTYNSQVTYAPLKADISQRVKGNSSSSYASLVHVSFASPTAVAHLRSLSHSVSEIIGLIGSHFGTWTNFSAMDFARTTLALYFLIPFTFTLIRWMFKFMKWTITSIKRICCPCCISPTVGVEEAAPDSESIELEEIRSVSEDVVEESAGPEGEIDQTSSADAVEDGGNNEMIENGGESPGNSDTELASDENEPFYYEIGSTRWGINHHYETIQSLYEATFVEISLNDEDDGIVTPIPIQVASTSSPNRSNNVETDFSPENATVYLEPMYTLPIDSIATDINRTVGSDSAETEIHIVDESERNIDLNAVEVISNSPTVSSNPSRTPSGTLMFVSDVFGRLSTFSKFRFFKRRTSPENISDATLPNISSDTENVFVDIEHSGEE